jgi:hypothetical protein
MRGLLSKIGFGRRIDCKTAGGGIVEFANFASKLQKPWITFLSIPLHY